MKANIQMKLSKKLASSEFLICFIAVVLFVSTIFCNVIANCLDGISLVLKDNIKPSIFYIIFKINFDYIYLYLVAYLIVGIALVKFIFNIKASYGNMIEGQKGSSRFAYKDELKEQYKEIDEVETKEERARGGFEGSGGIVISRYGKKVLLDDSPVNNLIIGTTRSGKGETFIFPTIDAYSRASKKASLVINDPKGELYLNSRKILKDRGYEVYALNLVNQLNSMSYNILELILDAYISKNYSEAQLLCKTLTTMLYYNPQEKNPFWNNCASSLVNALILAIIEEAFKEVLEFEKTVGNDVEKEKILKGKIDKAKEKVNMYAVANMLLELGGDTNPQTKKNALDEYFTNLPSSSISKLQYATSKFADGEARSGIFTTAMEKLQTFTYEETAKLTSRNSLDLKDIGFNLKAKIKSKVKVVKEEINNNEVEILNHYGKVNLLNVKSCFVTKVGEKIIDKDLLNGVDAFGVNNENLSKNVKVDTELVNWDKAGEYNIYFSVEDIKNSKPKAVFLITPDYDVSNHVISSMYVRQLYYVLAKSASSSKSGKCDKEVIFLLDEFGNMPAIEGLENTITVCLSRGIRFNLVIQSYEQLKKLYGEGYKTIVGNCGNQIYILTNENETAEEFSKLLGEKTIIVNSRSGEILDTTKHQTETLESRRLLMPDELLHFKEGEMAISRVIKRTDLKRNKIVAYPIFNTGKTSMKYRYEYLLDFFNTKEGLEDIEIPTIHKNVDLKEIHEFIEKDIRSSLNKNKKDISKNSKIKEENLDESKETLNKLLSDFFDFEEIKTLKSILNIKLDGVEIKDTMTAKELLNLREMHNLKDEKLDKLIEKIINS